MGTLARAVAKKVRTPPPPRRAVQAPQRRDTRRAAGVPTRPPWVYAAAGAAAAGLVAAAVIAFILVRDTGGGGTKTAANTNYNSLPGIRRTKAPWPVDYEFLADRLAPLGLETLSQEGVATHIHAHLSIFANGKRVTVPKLIGINPGAGYLTELHTHDTRGVIHVESPRADDTFTLGQFVGEWGVFLNARCIGAYCNGFKWYVDGKQQTGNPAGLTLKSRQQIALVAGKPPKTIPSTFKFAPGE